MSLYGAGLYGTEGGNEPMLAKVGSMFGYKDELEFGRLAFNVLSVLVVLLLVGWFAGWICKKEGLDTKLARMAQTPDAANQGNGANAPAAMGPIPSGKAIVGSVDCSQPQVGDDAWQWQRANIGNAGEPFVISPEQQMAYYDGHQIA